MLIDFIILRMVTVLARTIGDSLKHMELDLKKLLEKRVALSMSMMRLDTMYFGRLYLTIELKVLCTNCITH